MESFERYEHHGHTVWVRSDLKGLHKDYCLCYKCKKFLDGFYKCSISNILYTLCVALHLVIPVWECPKFEPI